MHYLHKILVYIPDVNEGIEVDDSELMNEIRLYAEDCTKIYSDRAYDWRETQTAGRWESTYPQNVIFAKDNLESFVRELEGCLQSQMDSVRFYLAQLKNSVGINLEKITEGMLNQKNGSDKITEADIYNMSCYNLKQLSNILYGEYMYDSIFYNTYASTGRIYKSDIEAVKSNPEDWAIVLFDYHF